jgi:ABC-type dipeptide/oligopeptide/nickel transport system permease component
MKGIAGYLIRRLASAALTLVLLSLVAFAMVKVIPGDEAHVAAGVTATPQQVTAMRVYLGLDKPWPAQYLTFLWHALHGDLGISISSHTSIATGIRQVLPETIQLALVGLVIMVVIAVPAAIASALRRRRASDAVVRGGVVVASGLPAFWLALIAQLFLATDLRLFPISGEFGPHQSVPAVTGMSLIDAAAAGSPALFWSGLYHLLLPATVLALPFTAQLYRALRTEIIKVLDSEFIDAARANGLSGPRLMLRHVLPNAGGPAITILGATVSMMIGSAILVESVFGLNGIGAYLINAVANSDRFAVIGGVLVIGAIIVAISFLVDIIQLARDPRLRALTAVG